MAMESHWLSWQQDETKPVMRAWMRSHGCIIPRQTFVDHLHHSGIFDMDPNQTDDFKKSFVKIYINELTVRKVEKGESLAIQTDFQLTMKNNVLFQLF